jgi:hypothetical protein
MLRLLGSSLGLRLRLPATKDMYVVPAAAALQ